jgi:DNA-binding NtrC family response regulator/tetratricopeptide (TPR) repeat protein
MDYLDETAQDADRSPDRPGTAINGPGPSRGTGEFVPPSTGTAELFARAGDWTQALHVYQELWNSLGQTFDLPLSDLSLARRLADCLEHLGRYQEAIRFLAPLLTKFTDAELLEPNDRQELGRCRHVLGKVYLGAGQMAQADGEAVQAAGLLSDVTTPELGNVQNLLSGIAFRRGDMGQAELHLRAAVEHFRSRGDLADLALSYMNLGHLYKQRCEWNRALDYYQSAYYLRATEGEFRDQGGILRNLALVLMKIGRYEEASEKLETSLRDAIQLGDPVRALRSRLALARLARESWQLEEARAHLSQCLSSAPEPVPEREGCLLLLEQAHLERLEENREEARALTARLRQRVERLASRGDLMLEVLLLEGMLELDRDNLAEAADWFRQALDLAREDRDRFQEHRALFGQAELAIREGRGEEAEQILDLIESRLARSGELPFLARVLAARGRLAQQVRSDPQKSLVWHTRARDLWRRMARPRAVALAELRLAEVLCDLERGAEAGALLRDLRDRDEGAALSLRQVAATLELLEGRVRTAHEAIKPLGLDGALAYRRLQEILTSDLGRGERLRSVLAALVEAVGADGGLLARVEANGGTAERADAFRVGQGHAVGDRFEEGPLSAAMVDRFSLEAISTVSMGRLQGRRVFPAAILGVRDPGQARLITLSVREGDETLSVVAAQLPVLLYGRDHILFLERRGPNAPAFTRSDLDYGMVLLAEAAGGLRPAEPGETENESSPDPAGPSDDNLNRARRQIWLADVVTQNKKMLGILELIRKVSDSDMTVLLQGETGTGKKLLALAVHRTSSRHDRPFVTVDCAALPESLLESELFGHRKGAFTGAVTDRVGLLEEANGGTIFLDEIDKAGLTVQRRFLHMLDSGEVRPVGATGYRRLNVRVVCATSSPDLRREVEAGRFLKDLYYRLNDISIVVPPLRERAEDVPLLAEYFVDRFAMKLEREVAGVSPGFHTALAAHTWPGNVRELEKAVGRAVTLMESGEVLSADLLPSAVLELIAGEEDRPGQTLREKLDRYERGLILEVLDRNSWNRTRTALELGLSRKGLKSKIQRYRLDRRQTRR